DQETAEHADHDSAAAAERGRGVGGDDQAGQDRDEADHVVPLLQVADEVDAAVDGLECLGVDVVGAGPYAHVVVDDPGDAAEDQQARHDRTRRDHGPPTGVQGRQWVTGLHPRHAATLVNV